MCHECVISLVLTVLYIEWPQGQHAPDARQPAKLSWNFLGILPTYQDVKTEAMRFRFSVPQMENLIRTNAARGIQGRLKELTGISDHSLNTPDAYLKK